MNKKPFESSEGPQAIGPYSQCIESQGFFYISGQIPIDPATQKIIESTAVADQTHRVLQNIKNILEARQLSFAHVVKTTIFLKNISDFPTVNEIYGSYFTKPYPARSTVEVAKLPRDVLIEIETIATVI